MANSNITLPIKDFMAIMKIYIIFIVEFNYLLTY
jgi:hypothetical protein